LNNNNAYTFPLFMINGGVIEINGTCFAGHSKILWSILVLLLFSLIVSIGSNMYLFSEMRKPHEEWEDENRASLPIEGHYSQMWDGFSTRITPNRAILSIRHDRYFIVSVTALYWAPLQFEPRPFYFKIFDGFWELPRLMDERTVIVDKSKDELDYRIHSNFTINLEVGGTHIYTVVGASWENVTLGQCDCWVTFAINVIEE